MSSAPRAQNTLEFTCQAGPPRPPRAGGARAPRALDLPCTLAADGPNLDRHAKHWEKGGGGAEVEPTFAAHRRRQEGAARARGASVAMAFLADPKTFESVFWPVCRGEAGRANVAELCAHIRSAATRLKFDTDAFPTLRALRAALFERANDAGAVSWDDLKGAVEATAGAARGLLQESSLET